MQKNRERFYFEIKNALNERILEKVRKQYVELEISTLELFMFTVLCNNKELKV